MALNRSEARVDFVVIQTLLLFICKSLFYYADQFLVSIISRSPLASLSNKGLVTFHTTVKWSIWNETDERFNILASYSLKRELTSHFINFLLLVYFAISIMLFIN